MADRPILPLDANLDDVPGGESVARGSDEDLFALATLGSVPLRHLRTMILTPLVLATALVSMGILRARYVSEAQFAPATMKSNLQGLTGVAAQFGFNIGNLSSGQSVDFYAQLVQSRGILLRAIETVYRFPTHPGGTDSVSADLVHVWRVGGKTRADSMQRAVAILRDRISTRVDQEANTVTIDVATEWPELSEAINQVLLDEVNRFNVQQLQSQASAERRFVEGRVADAKAELDSAVGRLRGFLEKNRAFQSSPRLIFENQRLEADVALRQQVYTTLTQSYEQARIAEVRDTPVITVIDSPAGSAERHRHIVRNGILGVLLGLLVGFGIAFGQEYVRQERMLNPGEYSELARLRQAALWRILPARLLRPKGGVSSP